MLELSISIAVIFMLRLCVRLFAISLIYALAAVKRAVLWAPHFLLRKAVDNGYTNLVRYICYLPINFNQNVTSLGYALRRGNLDIIRELLKNRAVQDTIRVVLKGEVSDNDIMRWGVDATLMILTSPEFNITSIDFISGLAIEEDCLQIIAQALINPSCKVKMLNFSGCQVTNARVETLASVLINPNCKVEKIFLTYNKITDVGAASLADAIRNPNCKLKLLDLKGNREITDNGVMNIVNAVNVTNKMTSLFFTAHVAMTKDGMKRCLDLISGNFKSSLKTFMLPLSSLNNEEQEEVLRRAPTKTKNAAMLFNMARMFRVPNSALRRLPKDLTRGVLAGMVEDKKPCMRLI